MISAFQPGRSDATVFLPAGLANGSYALSVRVSVMNSAGVVATADDVPVTVQWPRLDTDRDREAFVSASAGTARTAALTGNADLAVALIGGTAKLLNNFSAAARGRGGGGAGRRRLTQEEAAAEEARRAARESLGEAIYETVSIIQPSADALQSVSTAVAAIAEVPQELTQSAQGTLLGVLSLLASGGPVGTTAITNASAVACVSAAGQIALAALLSGGDAAQQRRRALLQDATNNASLLPSPPPAPAPPAPLAPLAPPSSSAVVLDGVLSLIGDLTGSLRKQLAVPGEAPVQVSGSQIQLALRLDSARAPSAAGSGGGGSGTAAGLASLGFTAPGSAASFAPLPPQAVALLSNASASAAGGGGDADPGVVSSFLALGFSPYPDPQAANSTAAAQQPLARLSFASGADGSEISVRGLTAPITFELPYPQNVTEGNAAQCRFWCEFTFTAVHYACALRPILRSRMLWEQGNNPGKPPP